MPPEACSILPMRRLPAPVKAPASWPNISLSKICSGTAPQFSAMNGLSWRGDSVCRLRATSSLPVPVSPLMSTGASVAATLSISARTEAIAWERPMMRVPAAGPASSRRRARFSSSSARRSTARRTVSVRRSAGNGFSMKSNAPSRIACTAIVISPWPVTSTTGMPVPNDWQCASTSSPLAPGRRRSLTTTP